MTNNSDNANSGRNHKNQSDISRTFDHFFDSLYDREKIAFMELIFLLTISGNTIRFIEEGQIAELLRIDEKILNRTIKKSIAHGFLQLFETAVVARSEKENFQDLYTSDVQSETFSESIAEKNSKPWALYRCLRKVDLETDSSFSYSSPISLDLLEDMGRFIELLANRVFGYYFGHGLPSNGLALETSPICTGRPKMMGPVILFYDDTKGDLNEELLDQIDEGLALWRAETRGLMISMNTQRLLHLARHCKLYSEISKALKTSPRDWPILFK